MKSIWAAIALAGTISFGVASSTAQEYPNRAIRIIVPLTPGSGADIVGRLLAKKMSESWGQPIVVENRAGAGTQIGTQAVARSTPDGYTLLVQSASHAVNPALYKSLPYDSLKDFVDVAIGHLKDGRLLALGVGTERRTTILPDVPTIAEQGVTGYAVNLWFGMWAPAGTPATVVNRLNAEVARSVAAADVREQFAKLGMQPAPMSPEAFAKYVRAEIAINQRIVADGGIERQ